MKHSSTSACQFDPAGAGEATEWDWKRFNEDGDWVIFWCIMGAHHKFIVGDVREEEIFSAFLAD